MSNKIKYEDEYELICDCIFKDKNGKAILDSNNKEIPYVTRRTFGVRESKEEPVRNFGNCIDIIGCGKPLVKRKVKKKTLDANNKITKISEESFS